MEYYIISPVKFVDLMNRNKIGRHYASSVFDGRFASHYNKGAPFVIDSAAEEMVLTDLEETPMPSTENMKDCVIVETDIEGRMVAKIKYGGTEYVSRIRSQDIENTYAPVDEKQIKEELIWSVVRTARKGHIENLESKSGEYTEKNNDRPRRL